MSIKIGSNDIKIMCDKIYVGTDEVYSSAPALTKRQTIEALVNLSAEENPTNKCFTGMRQLINSSYWLNNIGNIPIENYDNVILRCAYRETESLPVGRIWLYLQNGNMTFTINSNTTGTVNPYFATANGLKQYSWLYNERNVTGYYGENTATTSERNIQNNRRRLLYYWHC